MVLPLRIIILCSPAMRLKSPHLLLLVPVLRYHRSVLLLMAITPFLRFRQQMLAEPLVTVIPLQDQLLDLEAPLMRVDISTQVPAPFIGPQQMHLVIPAGVKPRL